MARTRPSHNPDTDVLLVEDHDPAAELVVESFSDAFDVRRVSDGGSAIATLRAYNSDVAAPDLIVLDVDLPDWSGFEVLAAKRAESELATVPTVMLSNSTAEDDRERARALGADRFLTKPMDIDELDRQIAELERAYLNSK